VSPLATISRTDGSVTNVLITRWGSVEVTRISMSFTVSRMRRRDPATSIRSAPPRAASASVTRAATARARGRGVRARPAFQRAIPLRMFARVFSRMPGTRRISPDSASASSRSTESAPSRS